MKIKNILALMLILLIMFLNVTSVFANEEIQNDVEIIELYNQNTNDISVTNSVEIDESNFNGYEKPRDGSFDIGIGIYQRDKFASYYFYNLKEGYYGNNTHGSCGYVAAAMLLCFMIRGMFRRCNKINN